MSVFTAVSSVGRAVSCPALTIVTRRPEAPYSLLPTPTQMCSTGPSPVTLLYTLSICRHRNYIIYGLLPFNFRPIIFFIDSYSLRQYLYIIVDKSWGRRPVARRQEPENAALPWR